jgi:hypothetical protein
MANKKPDNLSEQDVRFIIKDHKVFWTTVPIELPLDGSGTRRVGMRIGLVGTDADEKSIPDDRYGTSLLDKLYKVAQWLLPEESPNVSLELRKGEDVVFYFPGSSNPNRKNYAVVISIIHSGKFDEPMDEYQMDAIKGFEIRLKKIGCPKERWKEPHTSI